MNSGTLTVERQDILIPDFDPEQHAFTLNGKPLMSVTTIIKRARLTDSTGYNDFSRDRGKYVHQACQYWDEGDLEISTLDPEIGPYFASYLRFLAEANICDWDLIEQPLADRQGRFAGIVDRVRFGTCVADIKTGAYQSWHRLQLAAYCSMLPEPWKLERWAIYLNEDGYSLKVFPKAEYQTDLNAFIAAVNLAAWRAKYGN